MEAVFGFWALVVVVFLAVFSGLPASIGYLEGLNFTEPMFVFVVMAIAASKPMRQLAQQVVVFLARPIPLPAGISYYAVAMTVTPLLGSFITEPAAMTLTAQPLRDQVFVKGISTRLKYTALGVLFANVSIGGTLTPYAAPPVLMVAAKWGWDLPFMISTIGWKAALAVCVNAAGATALTAMTDNAALTYLGSLVEGMNDAFKYALVTGAVTGGGLTVIANAPNPAGWAILRGQFDDGAISPLGLFLYATPPTVIAIFAFLLL